MAPHELATRLRAMARALETGELAAEELPAGLDQIRIHHPPPAARVAATVVLSEERQAVDPPIQPGFAPLDDHRPWGEAGLRDLDSRTAGIDLDDLSDDEEDEQLSEMSIPRPHDGLYASGDRYQPLRVLGSGGQGRVVSMRDRDLGRRVALKTLRPRLARNREERDRFLSEIQITAQLEHPGIIPVHDIGLKEDGHVYFTMKEVAGESLSDIIKQIHTRDPEAVRRWPRVKLLRGLIQVALTLEFAHRRGVIHRDIKPSNIMFGAYGEVLVMDWGLARVVGQPDPGASRASLTLEDDEDYVETERSKRGEMTRTGEVRGSPPYMAPEQARGADRLIGARTDVYGMGAVLYQLLTNQYPFHDEDPQQILVKVVREPLVPPRERAPDLAIPPELEAICLRAMAKDVGQRYPSARAYAQELEAWLEGRQREERARERIRMGERHQAAYKKALLELSRVRQQLDRLRAAIPPWAPTTAKREQWDLEDRVRELENEAQLEFLQAEGAFEQALAYDDDNPTARERLGELYRGRLQRMQARRDSSASQYWGHLAERYGAEPERGWLEVETDGTAAELEILRLAPRSRMLLPVSRAVGIRVPNRIGPLEPGCYLIRARAAGCAPVQLSVLVEQGRTRLVRLPLVPRELVPRDFVVVPGGTFQQGGDSDSESPAAGLTRKVGAFAMMRFPVTAADWLEFLRAESVRAPERLAAHVPQAGGEPLWHLEGPAAGWAVPEELAGHPYGPTFPVVGVHREAAEAYAAWRGLHLAQALRLPTEAEWERAARGGDARFFPWGDELDPAFCHMAQSLAGSPRLAQVGHFQVDLSPCGIHDMAGLVSEWCAGACPLDGALAPVRGGNFRAGSSQCRAASRRWVPPSSRALEVGLRLVYSLG